VLVEELRVMELIAPTTARRLARFITDTVRAADAKGVVIGLSGGIDSAVAATLAVRGMGADGVEALILPHRAGDTEAILRAREVATFLGLRAEIVEIDPIVDAAIEATGAARDRIRRGNLMARTRMMLLYDRARQTNRLVLGTGNRTEALTGYTTLHGDAACDLAPLIHCYKREVRALARELGLPASVIEAAPSAGLWPGQTDEEELGISYELLDRLLVLVVDEELDDEEVRDRTGCSQAEVAKARGLYERSGFKRRGAALGPLPSRA
jgi:NAD+ synthase